MCVCVCVFIYIRSYILLTEKGCLSASTSSTKARFLNLEYHISKFSQRIAVATHSGGLHPSRDTRTGLTARPDPWRL